MGWRNGFIAITQDLGNNLAWPADCGARRRRQYATMAASTNTGIPQLIALRDTSKAPILRVLDSPTPPPPFLRHLFRPLSHQRHPSPDLAHSHPIHPSPLLRSLPLSSLSDTNKSTIKQTTNIMYTMPPSRHSHDITYRIQHNAIIS